MYQLRYIWKEIMNHYMFLYRPDLESIWCAAIRGEFHEDTFQPFGVNDYGEDEDSLKETMAIHDFSRFW